MTKIYMRTMHRIENSDISRKLCPGYHKLESVICVRQRDLPMLQVSEI